MLVTSSEHTINSAKMTQKLLLSPGPAPHITVIEWEMLDKKKFFPLSMMSSFTVRCFLYPLTLIRTRLQVNWKLYYVEEKL